MAVEIARESYNGEISPVTIGTDPSVTVGGETTMPFLSDEGLLPHPPVVAYEIFDCEVQECPDALAAAWGSAAKDPAEWARACVEEHGAQMLSIRLQSIHPDWGNRTAAQAVATVMMIRKVARVPLIIIGSGDDERDNDILPKVSQALKGENCLLGIATQNNYKTLTATCLADGHAIIAESPIDVNIAKQVNILMSDMGFDARRIVMHPMTAALGYGMEYVYSIMERARLAAFIGDKMLSMPFIVFAGQETWKTKEAREYGPEQGVNWELTTAVAMAQAGADILVMRHPDAARSLRAYIQKLTARP